MAKEGTLNISAIIVIIGGALALIYTFYFMQQLSYSIGVYSGLSTAIKAYNITNKTASSVLLTSLSQSTTLVLALHLTYALLPFVVMIFSLGVIWLFTKSYYKPITTIITVCALIYIVLVAILQFDFRFQNAVYAFPLAYLGGVLAVATCAYSVLKVETRAQVPRRQPQPISINPETPYSNMKLLSNRLMKRLSGELKILDMHFDTTALDNLMQLIDKNSSQYSAIRVLTKADRLGDSFDRPYSNFKSELENRKIEFELRILDEEKASKQHERILMDATTAYKIPPLNIINRKSEHIVGINHEEAEKRFSYLWAEAKKFENLKS